MTRNVRVLAVATIIAAAMGAIALGTAYLTLAHAGDCDRAIEEAGGE